MQDKGLVSAFPSCVFHKLCNISCEIHTGVVGFKQCIAHFVVNQALCAFRLCDLCRRIIVYHISKRIVELCGGRISVQSELGTGSKFTVILPVK